jgi:hypothetical protein
MGAARATTDAAPRTIDTPMACCQCEAKLMIEKSVNSRAPRRRCLDPEPRAVCAVVRDVDVSRHQGEVDSHQLAGLEQVLLHANPTELIEHVPNVERERPFAQVLAQLSLNPKRQGGKAAWDRDSHLLKVRPQESLIELVFLLEAPRSLCYSRSLLKTSDPSGQQQHHRS